MDRNSLRTLLEKTLTTVQEQANYLKGDKIRIVALNPKFNNPISTKTATNINFENLLHHTEDVSSDQNVDIHGTTFDIQIFKTH